MRVAVPLEQCWHEVPGGTARVSIDLVAALDRRPGIEVRGVSAWHRRPPSDPWKPPVPVRRLPLPRVALYEAWHRTRRPVVERATGEVDVVHVVGGAVAGHRAPLVVTIHDLAFRHLPEMFTRHGLRFFERALELTVREASRVLVPSLATLEDCASAGIDRARLRHVPWGVVPRSVEPDEVAAARRRFAQDQDYVVVVGTLEPRKNLPRLFRAWAALETDVRLVVVGPSGWGDAVGGTGATPPANVSMAGFVDDRSRDALYAGALASVYPSLFEGFGLPVLEAMALGCPVVTSSGTATEELVCEGAGIAVDPRDVDAIAGALERVLTDAELRRSLGEAGRRRAAGFTWDDAARRTAEAYDEVVA